MVGGQVAQGGMMLQNQGYMKQTAGGMAMGGDQADITKVWDSNNFKK